MDRGWPPALLIVLAALVSLAAGSRPASLAEMRWLDPGADRIAALTTRPVECLPAGEQPTAVEIGRAAFRSPLILGGQAARAGLACESCHQEGRGNPGFLFPGVSGAPGTADVTSSLFSSHRGDGVDDPLPIPDLSGPRAALKVSRDGRALETFIHGLVVEEFDGAEPPPAVIDDLAAYVRTLAPCEAARRPLTAALWLDDARRALRAGRASLAAGDPDTALVMIAAARARLGRIDERYPRDSAALPALRAADRDLSDAASAVRRRDPAADDRLTGLDRRLEALAAPLARDESASLFNPAQFSLPGGGP